MHGAENFYQIVILLIVTICVVAVFKKLNLSPVLGYLVAGSVLSFLSVIKDVATTKFIAEIGIIFLLFVIGLELTFERLKSMRSHIFGFGSAQIIVTAFIIGTISYLLGMSPMQAFIIGVTLSFSSTAVALQTVSEAGLKATQTGRLTLSTLIMQDLAVIPLLIMVEMLGDNNSASLLTVIGKSILNAVLVVFIIVILGRILLRPILKLVGTLKVNEIFIATTFLVVFGIAWLTNEAGLSLALGAFLAGLLVAETEYKTQIETDILPFKGLLMGLFFITIGMDINFEILVKEFEYILLITFVLLAVKILVLLIVSKVFKINKKTAIQSAFALSQGSEFAFVIFTLAVKQSIITADVANMFLVSVAISMAFTPTLLKIGQRISNKSAKSNMDSLFSSDEDLKSEADDLNNHIIIVGFGRVGKIISRLLLSKDYNNFICLESDLRRVAEARKENFPVYYGRGEKLNIYKLLGVEKAQMVIFTDKAMANMKDVVKLLRSNYPSLPIIVRVDNNDEALELKKAGASDAMPENFESSLLLASYVLKNMGLDSVDAERIISNFKNNFV
jgi:CPA2 family monovalent cation:H+ antiporter-2